MKLQRSAKTVFRELEINSLLRNFKNCIIHMLSCICVCLRGHFANVLTAPSVSESVNLIPQEHACKSFLIIIIIDSNGLFRTMLVHFRKYLVFFLTRDKSVRRSWILEHAI